MGEHRRDPGTPGELPGSMPPEASSLLRGALPPEIPGWHDETVTMPAIEQEAYSFPAPLAVNEEPGYQPIEDSSIDRALETTRRWGTRGVVLAGVGVLCLATALYFDSRRDDPFAPFVPPKANPQAQPTLSPSPTIEELAIPTPTKVSAQPAVRSAMPTPTKTESSVSPSATQSAKPKASPSASATESASPTATTSPVYTCKTGPELVVCRPFENEATMSTYPYPDATRPAEYVLSPGQEFVAECKLVSPADGRRWVLGLDGTYALQGIFGGNLSNVPDCDMN